MVPKPEDKVKNIFDSLSMNFGFNKNEWYKYALKLLLGKMVMDIRTLKEKKDYTTRKIRQYYDIGEQFDIFSKRRKKDGEKLGKKRIPTSPYGKIASLFYEMQVNSNLENWKGFSKRNLEACAYFFRIFNQYDELILDHIPWSIYFEITQQRKLLELPNNIQKAILEEIVNTRNKKGTKVSDRVIRAALKIIFSDTKYHTGSLRTVRKNIQSVIENIINEIESKKDQKEKQQQEEIDETLGKTEIKEEKDKKIEKEEEKEVEKKLIPFLYKRLSKNDVQWAQPGPSGHQAGPLIPAIAFKTNELFNFKIKKEDTVSRMEIRVQWRLSMGKPVLKNSNLIYYSSKREYRITSCPKELFYPNSPDYMFITKKTTGTVEYTLYLGHFNDKVYSALEKRYEIDEDTPAFLGYF
ncbi:MAG: hypothetical protein ACFFCS_20340 [Candidatus Hodarchaeota archaeon]